LSLWVLVSLGLCILGSLNEDLGPWVCVSLGPGSLGPLGPPGVSAVWVSRSSKYGTNQHEVRNEPAHSIETMKLTNPKTYEPTHGVETLKLTNPNM
jgi:hypothetical protein